MATGTPEISRCSHLILSTKRCSLIAGMPPEEKPCCGWVTNPQACTIRDLLEESQTQRRVADHQAQYKKL